MRLDKAKDYSIQKKVGNLIRIQKNWCNLKHAQEKGLLFYHPRHTTSCLHRESSVHEDEG